MLVFSFPFTLTSQLSRLPKEQSEQEFIRVHCCVDGAVTVLEHCGKEKKDCELEKAGHAH